MAKLGSSSNKTANDNKSSKSLSNHHIMIGNNNANHNENDNVNDNENGIGREDNEDDGHITTTLLRDNDEKGGSNGSSIDRGELVEEEIEEEEEVDDDDDNNDTVQREDDDEDESEMSPLTKNKSAAATTAEGGKKPSISSTTKNNKNDDDDNDIGGITPHSSSSSSSSSCCRKLSLLMILIFVFPIGLLLITQLMDRIVWAWRGDAFIATASNESISSNKQLQLKIPLPLPYYDEEEAKKYVFYSKVAFCTEHAITTWTCGYMCDTVPISTTRMHRTPTTITTTTTEGTSDDNQEHPETNVNKPSANRNMIRYIPEGRTYGVQGYVAQLPTTTHSNSTTTTTISNDLSDANAGASAGVGAGAGATTITTTNIQKCIVSFRGSLNTKNWYADFLILLQPWPTDNMRKNFTTTTNTTTTTTTTTRTMNTATNNTNTNNDVDWCQGCKAHHGFASAYDELRDDVHRAIEELQCTSLVLTGHSLGAAIATLASFDLRAVSGYQVESTWTYGLPRIGNAEFVNSFVAAATSQNITPPLWRIVHYHDPVPRLPPSINIGRGTSSRGIIDVHPVVHPPFEIYYTNRESSDSIECGPQQAQQDQDGSVTRAFENTSSVCMAGWPWYLSFNTDHISYLNESFAFKDFPEACKATTS